MNRLKVLVVGNRFPEENIKILRLSGHEVARVSDVDNAIQEIKGQQGDFSFIVSDTFPSAMTPITIYDLLQFIMSQYPYLVVARVPKTDERQFDIMVPRNYRITGARREPADLEEVACFLQILLKEKEKKE